jgi:hypothetical protein
MVDFSLLNVTQWYGNSEEALAASAFYPMLALLAVFFFYGIYAIWNSCLFFYGGLLLRFNGMVYRYLVNLPTIPTDSKPHEVLLVEKAWSLARECDVPDEVRVQAVPGLISWLRSRETGYSEGATTSPVQIKEQETLPVMKLEIKVYEEIEGWKWVGQCFVATYTAPGGVKHVMLITAAHVVRGKASCRFTHGGKVFYSEVAWRPITSSDHSLDISVATVPRSLPASLGIRVSKFKVGPVTSAPLRIESNIDGKIRKASGRPTGVQAYRFFHDCDTRPGTSGSPIAQHVRDSTFTIVGVHAGMDGKGRNYGIVLRELFRVVLADRKESPFPAPRLYRDEFDLEPEDWITPEEARKLRIQFEDRRFEVGYSGNTWFERTELERRKADAEDESDWLAGTDDVLEHGRGEAVSDFRLSPGGPGGYTISNQSVSGLEGLRKRVPTASTLPGLDCTENSREEEASILMLLREKKDPLCPPTCPSTWPGSPTSLPEVSSVTSLPVTNPPSEKLGKTDTSSGVLETSASLPAGELGKRRRLLADCLNGKLSSENVPGWLSEIAPLFSGRSGRKRLRELLRGTTNSKEKQDA